MLKFDFMAYAAPLIERAVVLTRPCWCEASGRHREAFGNALPRPFLGVLVLSYPAGLLVPAFDALRVKLITRALLLPLGWTALRIPYEARPAVGSVMANHSLRIDVAMPTDQGRKKP